MKTLTLLALLFGACGGGDDDGTPFDSSHAFDSAPEFDSAPAMVDRPEEGITDFTGIRVFCATRAREREVLGDFITMWIRGNPQLEIVDKVVRQSSDAEFHCFSITLFYREVGTSS